jgi:hypothetical protein
VQTSAFVRRAAFRAHTRIRSSRPRWKNYSTPWRLGWETNLFSKSLTAAGKLSAADPLPEFCIKTRLHNGPAFNVIDDSPAGAGKHDAQPTPRTRSFKTGAPRLRQIHCAEQGRHPCRAPGARCRRHFSGDRSVNAGLCRFVRRTEKGRPSGHLE